MKTFILSTVGAVLLASGGIGTNLYQSNHQTHHTAISQQEVANLSELPEYAVINEQVNLQGLTAKVVEDQAAKRILIFENQKGQKPFKSIFIKKESRLKIIDLHKGEIYNQLIESPSSSNESVNSGQHATASITQLPEYEILAKFVDLNKAQPAVVEDHQTKRIIIVKDNNHRVLVKSIFQKGNNHLKVIDTRGGLLYNGVVQ